ncbi:protein kinase domain-containing protein [Haliangium ochraceum]|uniref:Serine/threonine protein kinase n=1 Tax=Haliangium ochraceum (strain DSM 14365 / JCM 11303 / SMP-2) TaxID=502025 RepID=D0LWQ8_HALO1|nr:protein kinase [Haliangium ochraceum]ACY14155.1 serine/threonine protein kinase [Haliangium ochraceum DSM 14365]
MSAAGYVVGGRFELGRLLMSFGLARVFVARDLRDGDAGKEVAVKCVPEIGSSYNRNLMRREAHTLADLGGLAGGVVSYIDLVDENGYIYLVTATIAESLLDQWQAGRSRRGLLSAYAQLADIVARVHGAGYLHRDLKPAHVSVDERDGECRLCIIDMTLSVAIGNPTGPVHERLVGTLMYMSPEVLVGGVASTASDVFSLGVMLLQALVGRSPWPPGGLGNEGLRARLSPPPALGRFRGSLLGELLGAMLCAAPAQRPSASEVASALATAAAQESR